MPAKLSIELQGLEKIDRRMKDLPRRIQSRVLRRTLRVVGNKIKADLKAGTPKRSGLAKRSVNLKVKVGRAGGYAVVRYKSRAGSFRGRPPGMYMSVYEHGRKGQPARPFFKQAIGTWKQDAEQQFAAALREAIGTHGSA